MTLAFGCGPIGGLADRDQALATLAAAWDSGIRHFDTAPSYGDGAGEEFLGLALREWPRAEVTVSTKVGRVRMAVADPYGAPDGPRREPLFDFTARAAEASVATSLARLGLGHLDLVLVHDPENDLDLAVRETFPALRRMSAVRAVGVGTTSVDAARHLVGLGAVDVVMIAGAWSLTRRDAAPLLDDCAAAGVDVLAAAPFDSGLLACDEPGETASYLYRAPSGEVLARVRDMARICRAHGVRLPQAALRFPLRHPAVSRVVAGMRSPGEVRENAALMAAPVPAALWDQLR
ncbi:aldo/keto reductase [Amycolatopsis sp. K13G38]|uniref:Aldo/keto reductase n=1 Tax=Amycolatopsis acididurans TaxID=2724524 RepID=A0ABX1IZW1_9PSEU|nr:aldo/keto reductase [Amycolatopsis acididurans]NKQ51655.1 aldo/keto reductase [Amycolatopsis acididurans]